tara:strand:- start:118 stop:504 length:387 start_codon:yes stop_codon:yes gene_type:complete
MKYIFISIFLFAISIQTSFGQSFTCDFDYGVRTNKDTNKFETIFEKDGLETMKATYVSDGKNSRVIGANGTSPLTALLGYDRIDFIELTESGNNNYTTIYFDDNSIVHSRHLKLLGMLYVGQFYGTCK